MVKQEGHKTIYYGQRIRIKNVNFNYSRGQTIIFEKIRMTLQLKIQQKQLECVLIVF